MKSFVCDIRNALADAFYEYERGLDLLADWVVDRADGVRFWTYRVTIVLGKIADRLVC